MNCVTSHGKKKKELEPAQHVEPELLSETDFHIYNNNNNNVCSMNKHYMKRYKWTKIRKRRNQKKIPTPKTEVGKNSGKKWNSELKQRT